MMTETLRIGQLARRFDLNPKTIRYYEDLGLLPHPERTSAGYRQYGPEDVTRLAFIRKAKLVGLSLDEIAEILALRAGGARPCAWVCARLDAKVDEVNRQIAELEALRADLLRSREETLARSHEGTDEVCPIIEQQRLDRHAQPQALERLHAIHH
jgi:DNA-binding transcriptional MerR regulator